jgi:hypothetical protein
MERAERIVSPGPASSLFRPSKAPSVESRGILQGFINVCFRGVETWKYRIAKS